MSERMCSEHPHKVAKFCADCLTTLTAENERLREELEDGNAVYRQVMEEACAGGITYETDDRLHCTCVPHLREGVKTLTARVRALETALQNYGHHTMRCSAWGPGPAHRPCTCGLDAALARPTKEDTP